MSRNQRRSTEKMRDNVRGRERECIGIGRMRERKGISESSECLSFSERSAESLKARLLLQLSLEKDLSSFMF